MPMNIDADEKREMATQHASYEVHGALQRVERNESVYQAQRDALQKLRTLLTDFSGTLNRLKASDSQMVVNDATFSHEGYATAEVGGGAVEGNYQFFVEQLASAHQVAIQGLEDGQLGGAGALTIAQGDQDPFTIDLADLGAEATIADLAAAINDHDANTGVRANLVRSGGETILVLSSENTGADHALTLSTEAGTGAAFANAVTAAEELSAAQDAIVRLGGESGIALTNDSNSFDNIIDGVALTFNRVHGAGEQPLSVDIHRDMGATREQADTFVSAFNTLIRGIQGQSDSGGEGRARGPFAGDASVRALVNQLNSIVRADPDPDADSPQLHHFGITGNRSGQLQIDSSRFEAAVANDPEAFEALFSKADGLLAKLDDALKIYTNSTNRSEERRVGKECKDPRSRGAS